eukprot:TRINITY_DN27476_c0_g1_i1.p1 TRINITY_DN27476_c0_g1~~TRINITY_DN27476_c0_g1_i1.p1  ORF type:complete len:854 (+),score=203.86 TRINITY_DN27476_c0_g1_i1:154-2562(+)
MDPAEALLHIQRVERGEIAWDSAAENDSLYSGISQYLCTNDGATFAMERARTTPGTPLFDTTGRRDSVASGGVLSVRQGSFPDCFFCAAAGALGDTVLQKLFLTTATTPHGLYAVQFFRDGKYTAVIIDDVLPKTPEKKRVAYATSPLGPSVIWPSLLEKAYAKFYGGFRNIVGGNLAEAMYDLGGGVPVLREKRVLLDGYIRKGARELPFVVAGTPTKAGDKSAMFVTPNHAYVALPYVHAEGGGQPQLFFKLLNPLQNKARNCNTQGMLSASSVPEKIRKNEFFGQKSYILGSEEPASRSENVNIVKYVNQKEFEALFDSVHFGLKSFSHCGDNDPRYVSIPCEFAEGCNGGGPQFCSFRNNPVYRVGYPLPEKDGPQKKPAPAQFGKLFVTVNQAERRGRTPSSPQGAGSPPGSPTGGDSPGKLEYPLIGVTVVSTPAGGSPHPGLLCPGKYQREGVSLPAGSPPVPYSFFNTRTASYDLTPIVQKVLEEGRDALVVASTPMPGKNFPFSLAFVSGIPSLRLSDVTDKMRDYRTLSTSGVWGKRGAKPTEAEPNLHPSAGIAQFHRNAQYRVEHPEPASPSGVSIYVVLRQTSVPGSGRPPSDVRGLHQITVLAYGGASGVGEGGYGSSGRISPATPAFSNQTEVVLELKGVREFPVTLIPTTHKEGQESPYTLTVYSRKKLALSRISPAEVRRNGTPPEDEDPMSLSQLGSSVRRPVLPTRALNMGGSMSGSLSLSASVSSTMSNSIRRPSVPRTKSAAKPASKPASKPSAKASKPAGTVLKVSRQTTNNVADLYSGL